MYLCYTFHMIHFSELNVPLHNFVELLHYNEIMYWYQHKPTTHRTDLQEEKMSKIFCFKLVKITVCYSFTLKKKYEQIWYIWVTQQCSKVKWLLLQAVCGQYFWTLITVYIRKNCESSFLDSFYVAYKGRSVVKMSHERLKLRLVSPLQSSWSLPAWICG